MVVAAGGQGHVPDLAGPAERHSQVGDEPAEGVLQPAPVELVGGQGRLGDLTVLHAPGDVLVAGVAEEHAQAELAQLLGLQVVLQAEDVAQIVGLDLDAGLADLVGGLGHRVRLPFEDGDAQVRIGAPELKGQGQPGDAAAEDGHVEALGGVMHS